MLKSFLRSYFDMPKDKKEVVCLGGGVGTSQVLKGLRDENISLTAIVSMADDGGSAGRLRRAFSIPPPGDLINCITALSDEESILKDLFLYRFSGDRYGKDTDIRGQKLGNLIFLALTDMYKGDANQALEEFSKIISINGKVLPATTDSVNIWARTKDNKKVYGEQNIDLGKYGSKSTSLKEVHLDPPDVKGYQPAVNAISKADLLVVGPGDLFSTVLPVLLVNKINKSIKSSKAKKILIVNIANKPFETNGFKVSDYLLTIKKQLGDSFFDKIIINVNQKPKLPANLKYNYVTYDKNNLKDYKEEIIEADLVDIKYPIYHDKQKVAKVVMNQLI